MLRGKAIVDQDDWPEGSVPHVVLRGHDLVKDDKEPSLDEARSEQIVIESESTDNDE